MRELAAAASTNRLAEAASDAIGFSTSTSMPWCNNRQPISA
jgi:hypothetical protein